MTDNRKSGIALVAGSVGTLFTMAVHPVRSHALTAASVERLAIGSAIAHSLGMISVLLLVLGAFGLTRRLAAEDRLAFSGMVVFGFAAVAIMIATAVSGFIVPEIVRRMMQDTASAAAQWHIAIVSIFQINQAFARIYTVGGSVAVVLWSYSALRNGGIGVGFARYGCIAGPLLVLGIFSGHLALNVHGMGAVVLVQGIWFVGVGVQLYRAELQRNPIITMEP